MNRKAYPSWFFIPALLLYLLLFIYPSILGVGYSLTNWNRYSSNMDYVGLDNFRSIFTSGKPYVKYMMNTLLFTAVSNVVKIIPALFLALLLTSGVRGSNLYRSIMFFPYLLSTLVVAIIFRAMLAPRNGFVNGFLTSVGLGNWTQRWLADKNWVWPSIFFVDAWKGVGYVMTIFVAGLESIPKYFYEAGDIDGTNYFQRLWFITLPMLTPSITINLVFGLTYGLKVFDIIYALTNGGPGRMTEVLNTAIFTEIGAGNLAMASALSTLQFLLMTVLGYFVVKLMLKREVEA